MAYAICIALPEIVLWQVRAGIKIPRTVTRKGEIFVLCVRDLCRFLIDSLKLGLVRFALSANGGSARAIGRCESYSDCALLLSAEEEPLPEEDSLISSTIQYVVRHLLLILSRMILLRERCSVSP